MNESRFPRTLELECQFKFRERERERVFFGVLSQEKTRVLDYENEGGLYRQGLIVSLNGFSMWDKKNRKQRVGGKKSRVRTAMLHVWTQKLTKVEGWWPEEEPRG